MKLESEISEEIISIIEKNKTCFGNSEVLNSIISDDGFIFDLANKQFDSAKKALLSIESIDGVDENDDIENVLSILIKKCQDIERNKRDELERLCVNIVIKLFNIPNDRMEIDSKLSDSIDITDKQINVTKTNGDYSFDSIESASILKKECDKRNVLNSLCMGAGLFYSEMYNKYESEINEIDVNLIKLYKQILAINTYLLFCKKLEITDEKNRLSGICTIMPGDYENITKVSSTGIIFPILLSETIRGVMETFIMHGLPDDKKIRRVVIQKCDYVSSEPWHMMVGSQLWIIISKEFGCKGRMIPYLIKELSTLNPNVFLKVVPEILSSTKLGKKYSKQLHKKALRQFDKDSFDSEMSTTSLNKNVISDNII